MLRNYIRTSVRAVRRYAGFTTISVIGLAVAMAVSLLLILFVRDQAGKDAFHDDADRLYRVYSDFKSSFNRDNALYAVSPADLSERLLSDIPEVEDAAHLRRSFGGTVVNRGEPLNLSGLYADEGFLRLFDFELGAGDPSTALESPRSVVLTPEEARRLFGHTDVLGELVHLEDGTDLTVTGVFERDDYDSLIPLSAVVSMATLEADSAAAAILADWTRSFYLSYTYVLLRPDADPSAFESTLQSLIPRYYAEEGGNRMEAFYVQSITDINLGEAVGNEIGPVIPRLMALFLLALAAVILTTACFNYVGLTVSRSLQRAREVGVRKVFGAGRMQLFGQFIMESVVICSLSLLLAVGLLFWLEGQFNNLSFMRQTGMTLDIGFASDPGLYAIFLGFTLLIALVAGAYPALYLSRFKPAIAVRGASGLSSAGGSKLRKSLVVVQFAVSIIFVIVTIVMIRQSIELRNLDYGFETEQIANVRLQDVPFERFRDRVASSTAFTDIAGISLLPAMGSRADIFVWNPGDEEPTRAYIYFATPNYPEVMDIALVAGRPLRAGEAFQETRNVLVNAHVLDALGLGSPDDAVGRSVVMSDSADVNIVGVVENFRSNPANMAESPILIGIQPGSISWASLRVASGRMQDVGRELEAVWESLGSLQDLTWDTYAVQLESSFVNESMNNLLLIITFVAVLSIIIALLGLLGIATFNVQRRMREISIRKVLGATEAGLVRLLSMEFVVLLGLALVIAVPAGWFFSNLFLQTYAVRVGVGPVTFVAAIGLIGLLALATVSSQTVKAALADPVDNLKDE